MEAGKRNFLQTPYAKPIILILVGVLFVSAAAASITLTIPQTTVLAQVAVTSSACSGTLAISGQPTAPTGTVRYDCPSTPTAVGAFTVATTGTDTPTFNPPTQITAVGYVTHSASSCSGFTTLTSGTAVTLGSTGDFDICADYSCPTSGCTIGTWTFSWSS